MVIYPVDSTIHLWNSPSLSDSVGLVDFPIDQVDSVHQSPYVQVTFLKNIFEEIPIDTQLLFTMSYCLCIVDRGML